MQEVNMEAQVREGTGKERNAKLRKKGEVPAILYGKSLSPIQLTVKDKDVRRALASPAGSNVIVNLSVQNGKESRYTAMIHEIQQDIYGKFLFHVDFKQVSLTETIHASVKLKVHGTPKGEKEGGSLEQVMWEIQVEGLVSAIPAHLDVDVTNLAVGDAIHLKEVKLPAGIALYDAEGDEVVVIVHAPRSEAAAAEAAPAATPAPAATEAKE